jgi:tryptophan synthase alpha subunit
VTLSINISIGLDQLRQDLRFAFVRRPHQRSPSIFLFKTSAAIKARLALETSQTTITYLALRSGVTTRREQQLHDVKATVSRCRHKRCVPALRVWQAEKSIRL